MRLALFADIHSNYLVFKKAFEETKNMGIDKYIFLGDYITDGYDGDKILNLIRSIDHYAINGNREISIIEYDNTKNKDWNDYIQYFSMRYAYETLSKDNLAYIKSLEISKIFDIANKKICISHSTPYDIRGGRVIEGNYEIFDKLIADFNCDIYLFGHEHKRLFTEYKGKYFINPGSIGLPAYERTYNYGILDITEEGIAYESKSVDYNIDKLWDYYMNSEYHEVAPQWCEIIIHTMKDGKNHGSMFIKELHKKAKERNIDVTEHFSNHLFAQVFEEYKKENLIDKN